MKNRVVQNLLKKELATGINKLALASRIGIPASSLWNYVEHAVEPRPESLRKIATYFKMPVGMLIDNKVQEDKMTVDDARLLDLYRKIKRKDSERAAEALRYLEFLLTR